ncbi:hypothetical protein ACFL1D_05785 [Candidatus Omnitrophota bacterium]
MRSRLMIIAALLMLIAVPLDSVSASDNISLSISCTIPAIPGVNAPLIEEEAATEAEADAAMQTPGLTQEDNLQEIAGAEKDQSILIVRTIYSR